MQYKQPNFLLTGQVYPMLMSIVPHAWGTLDRKSTLLNWQQQFCNRSSELRSRSLALLIKFGFFGFIT